VKASLAMLLEVVDPFALVPRMGIGGRSRDAKPLGQFGNGVLVQLKIFEKSLSLFAHGDTSPGL